MELFDVRVVVAALQHINQFFSFKHIENIVTMSHKPSQKQDELISVIIPAFNEEEFIDGTITALQRYAPEKAEIIIIDNGSTDTTVQIATSKGVKVIQQMEGTIASLRNRGVNESSGNIFIFIDADVTVTEAWGQELKHKVITNLIKNPIQVTGSRCLPPDDGKPLNTHWFSLLTEYEAPYINSGHLITSKELFEQVGGFSEQLKTAEDYDFCMKAKACNADLVNNPKLPVYHFGYPEKIQDFIARERWHGREDFETLQSFSESKVGIAAAGNLLLAIIALLTSLVILNFAFIGIYFLLMLLICVALTAYKFERKKVRSFPVTAGIFYLYLTGRSLALIDRLRSLTTQK